MTGTCDARGYVQWKMVGRKVKRGSKCFYILAPCIRKIEHEEEEKYKITGFLAIPVFRVEDTVGEPLDYQNIQLPDLPLIDVANKWNIKVKAIPGNYKCLGFFRHYKQEIGLASKEEVVFFHELSHAAHLRVKGHLGSGQNWRQEIVAELSAAALCHLTGKDGNRYLGTNYQYIEHYAVKAGISPYRSCIRVMNEVEKVLEMITGEATVENWAEKIA